MNAIWHKTHRLSAKATPKQRLRWHLAHQKACDCRELTAAMLQKLRRAIQ